MAGASASDLAEIAGGGGSARDKAEAAKGYKRGSTRRAIKARKGGPTKKRRLKR